MKIPRASHSGMARFGDAEMPVHVLPGGAPIVEVTSIESMIGLPPTGLGDFFTTLPGGGGRVQFERAADACALCTSGSPAANRLAKTSTPCCGKCAEIARQAGASVVANRGPMVTVWGLPAEDVPDLLAAFVKANSGKVAEKARVILSMLVDRGVQAARRDPAAAMAIMKAALSTKGAR